MNAHQTLLPSAFALLTGLYGPAGWAAQPGQEPGQGPAAAPAQSTVADILKAPVEGTEIRLRGRLVRRESEGRYLFSDGSGAIRLEAGGLPVPQHGKITGQTTVEVIGAVEGGPAASPTIDVRRITVIAP